MNRRIRGIPILLFLAGFCAACGGSSGAPPIPPAEKTWGAPALLQQDNTTGSSHDPAIPLRLGPVVRFDAKGKAMVFWPRQGAAWDIVAVRYDGAWGDEAALDNASENAFRPMFAWDGTGAGHLVWYEWDGFRYNMVARRNEVEIAVDAAGTAFAAWRHNDGVANHLWANRFDPAQGWGIPGPIEPDTAENVTATPAVAVDPGGNAVALWRRGDGPGNSLFANRYVAGRGWGDPVPVEPEPGDVAPELGVDVDPEGNAIAVWLQDDGTDPNGKRYTVRANVLR